MKPEDIIAYAYGAAKETGFFLPSYCKGSDGLRLDVGKPDRGSPSSARQRNRNHLRE